MAYREIAMWEILEVLPWVERGKRHRAIVRVAGHSRSTTIRRWLRVAAELGWEPASRRPRGHRPWRRPGTESCPTCRT